MYAAYALSSIMTPSKPLVDMRAAGVIPALITVLNTSRVLASKKGAMRALGRLARSDESAVEIVESNGLPPIIALLDCEDSGLVRRCVGLGAALSVSCPRGACSLRGSPQGADRCESSVPADAWWRCTSLGQTRRRCKRR